MDGHPRWQEIKVKEAGAELWRVLYVRRRQFGVYCVGDRDPPKGLNQKC